MLSPYVIVTIQFTLGLIIFGTICREYVLGWLQRSDVFVAIAPVLLYQGFRFLGLIAPLLVLSHGYVLHVLIKRKDEFSTSVA